MWTRTMTKRVKQEETRMTRVPCVLLRLGLHGLASHRMATAARGTDIITHSGPTISYSLHSLGATATYKLDRHLSHHHPVPLVVQGHETSRLGTRSLADRVIYRPPARLSRAGSRPLDHSPPCALQVPTGLQLPRRAMPCNPLSDCGGMVPHLIRVTSSHARTSSHHRCQQLERGQAAVALLRARCK